MPACPSSPIPVVHLAAPAALTGDQCRSLLDSLAHLADPRQRRGRRHRLVGVLGVAVAAVLAGARSLAAIGEWAADAPGPVLAALGTRRDPLTGAFTPPAEATVRRVLARIDPDALDGVIGRWLASQPPPPPASRPPPPRRPHRAVAVDGKTLRGSGHHGRSQVHLLAAMDHTTGVVLAQTEVDHTTNEIARFRPLLERLDLTDTVVTADALHTQREHADWLVTHKHAAWLLVVKHNQPALYQQLIALPWHQVPVADRTRDRGHGRVETRRLQVTTVAGLDFPHAAQALRITRRARPLAGRRWRTVTVYAITSLTAAQASPARLADWIRGHWGIEALHHIRESPSPRMPPSSALAPPPGPWPACATSPLRSCGATATATSPPRCATTPATRPACYPCSAAPAHEPGAPAADTLPSPAASAPRLLDHTSTLTVEHVLAVHRAARHNRPEHGRGTDLPQRRLHPAARPALELELSSER